MWYVVASVGPETGAGGVAAGVAGSLVRLAGRSAWRRLAGGGQRVRGPMSGWVIPPPSRPLKSEEDLRREREAKIGELGRRGLLRSGRLHSAMLNVAREDFIPSRYRDHAYEEIPLPLPGEQATISCPHSYPLFYEPLGLGEGHRFLEAGVGSGYGTALAREVVGPRVSSWPSRSTPQRSRSPARTWTGPGTRTSS
jgi:protein-L-isoaspartate(D-aspartate) O-methyltransferase (PCMT)